MIDVGLLILRLTTGTLVAGHGAQKLFGWFGGSGLRKFADSFESLGLSPGRVWAPLGGGAEFVGGLLTAAGLGNPLGPLAILAVMATASLTAHRGKPIWVTTGGAELPVTNMAIALAIALAGAGRYSLDALIGRRPPAALVALASAAAAAGVATGAGTAVSRTAQPERRVA